MDNTKDKSADLIDAIYKGLPATMFGCNVDMEFNDDNTITVLISPDEYLISVARTV